MNSVPPQPFDKNVNLKILYTFDDKNTFLARSTNPIKAKIITLPNQPPHNGIQIGCIELKSCLNILNSISPEWFQNNMDYSIYYKDIIEVDQPYVATGLYSNITSSTKNNQNNNNQLITGRLCTNLINLYQSNNSIDTLDIKLRLSPVNSNNNSNKRKSDHFTVYDNPQLSSPLNTNIISNQHQNHQQPIRKRMRKSSISKQQQQLLNQQQQHLTLPSPPSQINRNINNLSNNLPQLASRTQSLPFITEDSLAHKIRLSDMISSKRDGLKQFDSRGESISSRFQHFPKSIKEENDVNSQPTKAKKSKSFYESVVKIGDTSISQQQQNTSSSSSSSSKPKKKICVNCMISTNPPYKFFKDGIFEFGNSGYLCSICTFHQSKNDIKLLRERGQLGSKGLLDGPYIKNNTTNTSNKSRSKKKLMNGNINVNASHLNPNSSSSSLLVDNSSSPLFLSSSPMNLQTGFLNSNNIPKSKRQNDNFNNNNSHMFISKSENIHEFTNNLNHNDDLLELLKLDQNFGNFKTQAPPSSSSSSKHIQYSNKSSTNSKLNTENNSNNNIHDIFTIPNHKIISPQMSSPTSSSAKGTSKNNSPSENENENDCYRDLDNMPMDATKLNTTLIRIDDDEKENFPPDNNDTTSNSNSMLPPLPSSVNEFTGISPSIQRIIESFSNEPSSPTKTTGNDDWNYTFFSNDNDDDDGDDNGEHNVNNNGNDDINVNSSETNILNILNDGTECDDPEINRILNGTNTIGPVVNQHINNIDIHTDKYEITPRDPGTSQSQNQSNGSPNGFKMTPLNTENMELNISSIIKTKNNEHDERNENNENIDNNTNNNILDNEMNMSIRLNNPNKSSSPVNKNTGKSNQIQSKKLQTAKSTSSRITMPSSPFFNIQNDNNPNSDTNTVINKLSNELEKEDKLLDTSNSMINSTMNWVTKSSPVTDPLSSSGLKN